MDMVGGRWWIFCRNLHFAFRCVERSPIKWRFNGEMIKYSQQKSNFPPLQTAADGDGGGGGGLGGS